MKRNARRGHGRAGTANPREPFAGVTHVDVDARIQTIIYNVNIIVLYALTFKRYFFFFFFSLSFESISVFFFSSFVGGPLRLFVFCGGGETISHHLSERSIA